MLSFVQYFKISGWLELHKYTRGVPILMPPVFFFFMLAHNARGRCCGMTAKDEPSQQYPTLFCWIFMQQMAEERQSGKTASVMEVWMKQRCGTEFLHVEKNSTHSHSSMLAECLWKLNSGCSIFHTAMHICHTVK